MTEKVVLITGITGQDGSYLAEMMLNLGYRVIGTVRKNKRFYDTFLKNLLKKVELLEWNLLDQEIIVDILLQYKPSEIYNFAAYSSGSGMFDEPIAISEVNGLAVTRILEAIRRVDTSIRFCQASSREIFGEAVESPQTELTLTNPRSPYGAAKLYADSMIRIYRQRYNLFVCSAILFNHESPRRSVDFVTRKITHEAVRIKLGLANRLNLGNLNAQRDWGFAGDYVRAMWLMLQQKSADDYIVATGESHSVQEFCEEAFGYLGLDYREYVKEDSSDFRSGESVLLVGNPEKAKNELGWFPEVGFKELISMMVDEDLRMLNEKIQEG